MSRFGRNSHLSREPDYGVTSAWDTRTYLGLDDNVDDGGEPDRYSRRTPARDHHRKRLSASVSVIGYGDPEPRPTRAKQLSFRTRDGERRSLGTTTRDRDRPRTTTGATRQYRDSHTTISVAPAYHHRTSPFTFTPSTGGHEQQQPPTLKQRLSLSRQPTPERDDDDTTGGFVLVRPPFQQYLAQEQHHQQQPPRARSLSLSRAPGYASYPYYPRRSAPSSVSSLEDEEGVLPDERASYQHRRVSLSASPPSRVQWPPVRSRRDRQRQRSVDVEVEGDGGWWVGREQEPELHGGYAGVRRRTDPVEARRSCDDDLRCRLGGGAGERLDAGLVDPRSVGRRSRSFEGCVGAEGVGGRRKGLSPAARGRAASNHRDAKPHYNQVHALILTWSFHDLRTEDYTAPPTADYVSLEDETARLRATLEGYGYTVHEFLIPMHRSAESLKAKLKQFCRYAADDTLLIVYYHGHGALNDDNELVFSSHDHPNNPQWSQAAAAELYAALLSGDACASHGHRQDRYQELIKKYERYRPVSTVKWAAIRNAILSAPSDVLLVLDCCAAGGANLPPRYLGWNPPLGGGEEAKNRYYTKHLFAACGFESSTSDDMTAAMCEVLDEAAVPPAVPSAPGSPEGGGFGGGKGGGNGRDGREGAGGGMGGQGQGQGGGEVLTTKRLHQLMEDKLQKRSVGSQPIFKQLLPQDPEQYITLPNFRDAKAGGERRGRRGYVLT